MSTNDVIELSQFQSFQLKGVAIVYKDSLAFGDVLPDAKWGAENPIPVVDDGVSPRELGTAVVRDEGERIVADLFLERDCPQRLEIETQSRRLFPIAWCEIVGIDPSGKVTALNITHIEVRPDDCPFDDRLQPLSVAPL